MIELGKSFFLYLNERSDGGMDSDFYISQTEGIVTITCGKYSTFLCVFKINLVRLFYGSKSCEFGVILKDESFLF